MLTIIIPETEIWDSVHEEFINTKTQTLELEHSLLSLSKWESKWQIPFLGRDQKTTEQTIDYIRCMTINKNVDPKVYNAIPADTLNEINNYISSPMSATTISKKPATGRSREIITSEVIYYWMVTLNIPFECQKWHLNRLLMLIEVCNAKNSPAKKMGKQELAARNRALNAERRAKLHSKG